MPVAGGRGPLNHGVALHDEVDSEARAVKEFAGAERIYWVQCPRCRQRYWYALRYDTGATEAQYFGASFRRRFRDETCPHHSLTPLLDPTATPESD